VVRLRKGKAREDFGVGHGGIRQRPRSGRAGAVALLGGCTVAGVLLPVVPFAAQVHARVHTVAYAGPGGARVLGWGLNGPDGLLVDGRDLFVANGGGNSVTELPVGRVGTGRQKG
jgi:hypothetical protein